MVTCSTNLYRVQGLSGSEMTVLGRLFLILFNAETIQPWYRQYLFYQIIPVQQLGPCARGLRLEVRNTNICEHRYR